MLVIVSRRPLLSMARYEFEVYNTIDGHKSVDELERRYPVAGDLLVTWRRAAVIHLFLRSSHHPDHA